MKTSFREDIKSVTPYFHVLKPVEPNNKPAVQVALMLEDDQVRKAIAPLPKTRLIMKTEAVTKGLR